jgi:hypothetical protein
LTCNLTPALSNCSSSSAAQRISVTRLDLTGNGLVGFIDNDTRVEQSLRTMHDCGLTALILGAGDIGINGTLAPFWGTFTNLQQLVITKSSIYGPLPANLGNLVQLRQLDLNGNYMYGESSAQDAAAAAAAAAVNRRMHCSGAGDCKQCSSRSSEAAAAV